MKLAQWIVLGLTAGSLTVSAQSTWGGKELSDAAVAAGTAFKAEHGEEHFSQINGISVERIEQGTGANASVSYVVGEEVRTAQFFCHNHGDIIDCH